MAAIKALLFLLPALATAKAVLPHELFARDCTSNNCVRAIRADNFPTRSGTADCLSFLRRTVTPAASTLTVTVSSSFSATITSLSTSVIIAPTTAVETEPATSTSSVSSTTTITVTTTSPGPDLHLEKRQVTAGGTSFPAYASACTSFAKYSSACSCLGVTAQVTTLPTPIQTVSVTVSVTSTLSQATTTTTVLTTTLATSTLTHTDATVTISDIATASATTGVSYPFHLQATNTNQIGRWVKGFVPYEGPYYFFDFTTDINQAWTFSLEGTDLRALTGENRLVVVGDYWTWLFTDSENDPTWIPLVCNIGSGAILHCQNPSFTILQWCPEGGIFLVPSGNNCQDLSLKVVPA